MKHSPSKPPMSERRTGFVGGALIAVGPLSMALYIPALPTLVESFATTPAAIKLTVTAYFTGFAVTQLVCGPLSDCYGRKPVTFGFVLLYLASSVLALFAPTVEWLILARLLQGMGASVGVAVSRAIVRDQYTGQTSARIMNMIGTLLAVGPAFAPITGGVALVLAGWQAIFALMVVYGIALVLVGWLAMRETNHARDPESARPSRLLGSYWRLLCDIRFMAPSLTIGLTLGVVYVFAVVLPFVLIERVGLDPIAFGLAMLAQGSSFLIGTLVVSRILKKIEAPRLVPWGLAIMLCASAVLFTSLTFAPPTVVGVIAPVSLLTFGIAFVMPWLATSAIAPFPKIAGAASALMGFLQIGGGLAGSAVAALIGDPVVALATVVPAMPLLASLIHFLSGQEAVTRRHVRKHPPEPVPPPT